MYAHVLYIPSRSSSVCMYSHITCTQDTNIGSVVGGRSVVGAWCSALVPGACRSGLRGEACL